jgi:hypothetical protein
MQLRINDAQSKTPKTMPALDWYPTLYPQRSKSNSRMSKDKAERQCLLSTGVQSHIDEAQSETPECTKIDVPEAQRPNDYRKS